LQVERDAKVATIVNLENDAEQKSKELSSLRNRTNLSQQNWLKEKEEMLEQADYIRVEFEETKQAMHNWEVLAMEERSIRESLGEKVVDLEEQLSGLRDEYERAASENTNHTVTIDGLQRALQEIQTGTDPHSVKLSPQAKCANIARKQELREIVQSSDAQLEELKHSLEAAEKLASEAESGLQNAQQELERLLPFEKEVKEKNLLIGKLRHEAVTLNDHLTKALRFLKRGKPEDNVDRYLL
jgi:exonuclease VII small subunit